MSSSTTTSPARTPVTRTTGDPDHAVERRGSRLWGVVVLGIVAVALVRALLLEPVVVPTASMSPTIQPGEHLVVRHGLGLGNPVAGDVVLVEAPDGELMVKRVVAVGGQRVGIRDGRLVVDREVQSEPYTDADAIDSVYFGPVTVPAGHVFVLGDNRFGSEDSREYGSLPLAAVQGTVLGVWWPLDAARWIR
jgi:signal peptidase I